MKEAEFRPSIIDLLFRLTRYVVNYILRAQYRKLMNINDERSVTMRVRVPNLTFVICINEQPKVIFTMQRSLNYLPLSLVSSPRRSGLCMRSASRISMSRSTPVNRTHLSPSCRALCFAKPAGITAICRSRNIKVKQHKWR